MICFLNKFKIDSLTKSMCTTYFFYYCKKIVFLIFDNYLYCQIDGVAMGSNLGPNLTLSLCIMKRNSWSTE